MNVKKENFIERYGKIGIWVHFHGINGLKLFSYDLASEQKAINSRSGIFDIDLFSLDRNDVDKIIRIYVYSWWYVFYRGYSVVFLPHKYLKFCKNFDKINLETREFIHAWRDFDSKEVSIRAKYNCGAKWCCDGKYDKFL